MSVFQKTELTDEIEINDIGIYELIIEKILTFPCD